jgi:hypothetical protein
MAKKVKWKQIRKSFALARQLEKVIKQGTSYRLAYRIAGCPDFVGFVVSVSLQHA